MNRKPLAIFGAGGLGRELKTWIGEIPEYNLVGFLDEHLATGTIVDGTMVLGGLESIVNHNPGHLNIVLAIGDPAARARVVSSLLRIPELSFPVFIHPTAIIQNPAAVRIGAGSVITAGCVLTTNIFIGKHVLINLNSTIGHDGVVGDCSCIMPGVNISGNVTIGKNVLVGTGANVLNNLSVGANSKIGAGAVVIKPIPENCTAVGVPAKVIGV